MGYVKKYWGDESEDQEGRAGYVTEANGLNADFFITQYPQDLRHCMYATNAAIMRDVGTFSDQFSDTIVASENLVRTWSRTGVPLDDNILGWDIPSDPTVAARFLGRNVSDRQKPPQLPLVELCLAHRAFLRMDVPISEDVSRLYRRERSDGEAPRHRPSRHDAARACSAGPA